MGNSKVVKAEIRRYKSRTNPTKRVQECIYVLAGHTNDVLFIFIYIETYSEKNRNFY